MREKKKITVRRGNVSVDIYTMRQVKKGVTYTIYGIADYSSGKRRFKYEADLDRAKEIASEVADAIALGRPDVNSWEDDLRVEIKKSMEALKPTGVTLLPASQLFSEATKILGGHDQLLAACQYWKSNGPTKPFTPKPVKDAADHLNSQQAGNSDRRKRNVANALDLLVEKFADRMIHDLTAIELKDFVDGRKWGPKTYNDFLGIVSLLFKEAQFRGWVIDGHNPAREIKRRKWRGGNIGVFAPWEARQLLSRIDPDLTAFFAIWLFSGIRKEEASRLTWQQVNRGIETGWITVEASQAKTQEERNVPVSDNLKLWLLSCRKTSGDVLPARWQGMERLSELTRLASRRTGIVWQDNGPRHSYATYYFKLHRDAGATVKAMGTSLGKFQRHYWCKSEVVTEKLAQEYFGIVPESNEKITQMPAEATA